MAKLKIMNQALGTNFLKSYGIDGIDLYIKDIPGKRRFICSCGEVLNKECPNCKHENIKKLNVYNYFNRVDLLAEKEYLIADTNALYYKRLKLNSDRKANTFVISEVLDEAYHFNPEGLISQSHGSNDGTKIIEAIDNHPEEFSSNVIQNMDKYKRITKIFGENNRISLFPSMFNVLSKMYLDEEDYKKYANFFVYFIQNTHILSMLEAIKMEYHSIDQILLSLNLPTEFKPFFEIFEGERYLNIPSKNKIIPELNNCFLYSLMHQQLSLSDITYLINNVSDLDENEQREFIEFFVKNISLSKRNVLSDFQKLKSCATKHGLKELDIKRLSKLEIQSYLNDKKVNPLRVERVIDIFDTDPILVLDLLASNGKLSKEENKNILKRI